MKNNEYYIFEGKNPQEWAEGSTLGPFTSAKKAETELRKQCHEDFMNQEAIDPNDYEEWFSRWSIMKIEKIIQPKPKLSLKVSLGTMTDEQVEKEENLERSREVAEESYYSPISVKVREENFLY
jgi:hypothetical protein